MLENRVITNVNAKKTSAFVYDFFFKSPKPINKEQIDIITKGNTEIRNIPALQGPPFPDSLETHPT